MIKTIACAAMIALMPLPAMAAELPAEILGEWCSTGTNIDSGRYERGVCSDENDALLTISRTTLRIRLFESTDCAIDRVRIGRRKNIPVYTVSLRCDGEGRLWTETTVLYLVGPTLMMETTKRR